MHVEGLVGHSQVPVGGRLTAAVIHLLADGQLLLVVLDCLGHTRKKIRRSYVESDIYSYICLRLLAAKQVTSSNRPGTLEDFPLGISDEITQRDLQYKNCQREVTGVKSQTKTKYFEEKTFFTLHSVQYLLNGLANITARSNQFRSK